MEAFDTIVGALMLIPALLGGGILITALGMFIACAFVCVIWFFAALLGALSTHFGDDSK